MTCILGAMLRRRLIAAASDMAEYTIGHHELENTIPAEMLDLWAKQVEVWEKDKSQPNPYEIESKGGPKIFVSWQFLVLSRHQARL